MKHPIDSIEWVSVNSLTQNMYNPNKCLGKEYDLLKISLLRQGWIQPILAAKDNRIIIDGFHRWNLVRTDKEVFVFTKGKVPVAFLDVSEIERKMLTVRINRAKGVHVASLMHDLVTDLVKNHGCSVMQLCEGIGATKEEIELLLMEGVFVKKDVANTNYSRSWVPKGGRITKRRKS